MTEQRHGSFGVQRSLHLGSHKNVPESIVRLELVNGEWRPVASALLKPHLQHSLLAFAFLPAEGFPANSRAALVGCAAGSLLHFWRECVPGGTSLRVDAVEIDGAVLVQLDDDMLDELWFDENGIFKTTLVNYFTTCTNIWGVSPIILYPSDAQINMLQIVATFSQFYRPLN